MTIIPAQASSVPPAAAMEERALLAAYPDAKVIHISPEEYPRLAAQLEQRGYQQRGKAVSLTDDADQLPQAIQPSVRYTHQNPPLAYARNDCSSSSGGGGGPGVNLNLNIEHGGRGGHSNDAAVYFVIIGTVVLVVWAAYVFKYLYDVSMGDDPCRWAELSLSTSVSDGFDRQHLSFTGVSYKGGMMGEVGEFGISAEVGNANIRLVDNGILDLHGLYWLVGPTLRWPISSGRNPGYFLMDFAAGSTENPEVGLLARATIGLQMGLGDAAHLTLNWGVLNLNLHERQGLITEHEQYYYLYGLGFGFQF